jgi:hypothetical protein
VYGKVARSPVQSVNREIDEEFHLSLFICHLILVIDGGDLESMPNIHRVISGLRVEDRANLCGCGTIINLLPIIARRVALGSLTSENKILLLLDRLRF